MKKFVSIILSMIIILSAFSVTSFATSDTQERNKINVENGICVRVNTSENGYKSEHTLYAKGDKMAMVTSVESIKVKIIFKENTVYVYFPAFPFFYFKEEGIEFPTIDELLDNPVSDMELSDTYQQTINGVTYDVDFYTDDNDNWTKYFYENNNLKFIESLYETDGDYSTAKFEIISTEVNDKVFRLPFFAIDFSVLSRFFSRIF